MLAVPDKMMCVALALTMTLAMAPRDPLWLWERAHRTVPLPRWLPVIVLVGLALLSGAFGIGCPEQFAAAFGQEAVEAPEFIASFSR